MTRYNTGNPLGSTDPRDLYDNAENLDRAINDESIDEWTDRLGVQRISWNGMEARLKDYIANGGFVPYETAASLPTSDPGEGSRLAWVSNDDTPENNGAWVWDSSAGQFVKSNDLSSQLAVELGVVDGRQGGLDVAFLNPNLVQDTNFSTMIASGSAFGTTVDGITFFRGSDVVLSQTVAEDGRPALSYSLSGTANSFIAWGAPAASVASVFSASIRLLGGQAAGSVTRVMLQQFTDAGAEITAVRRTAAIPVGVVSENLVAFSGVTKDASAASVRLRVDSNNSSTTLQLTDVLIGNGRSARFRPDWKKAVNVLVSGGVDVAVTKSAASQVESFSNPNLIGVGTFDFTGASPVFAGTLSSANLSGVKSWRQRYAAGSGANESAVEFGPFPVSAFPSGKVSAGVNLVAADAAASGWVRVLLRQFNGAAEITSARQVVMLTTLSAVTSEVMASFSGVAIDPSCTSIRLYLGVIGATAADRFAYWRSMLVADGISSNWRAPASSTAQIKRSAYVSPTGSDANSGAQASPFATLDAAVSSISGDGAVYVLPGVYGSSMRLTPALVTGKVSLIGVRTGLTSGNYVWPSVVLGDQVTGITKTAGRTKVYQATVSGLPTLNNFQWAYQHGVPDPTTLIDAQYRFPQHRGRTYRLQSCAKLIKTTATTLNDALSEIDASATPKAFIDSGVLYFSIVGGGDATSADIRLDSQAGLVASSGVVRGSCGSISITGMNIMYGGLDLSPFRDSYLEEINVCGSRVNAIDYNVLSFKSVEGSCSGSQSQFVGDVLNGHFGSVCVGFGFYGHDCNDDAASPHEGSSLSIYGGLVEYCGGTGIAPAYGADSVIMNVISVRNQRRGTYKAAAFYVTGAPSAATPPESGADTNATFIGCVDYESLTGFADDYTISGGTQPVTALCIDCKSIRPTTRGFNVRKIVDCRYTQSTTSTARNPSTIVESTSVVE